jgi:hypothetical protein
MDKFTIPTEYLDTCVVTFTCPAGPSGMTGTVSSVDHPSFAALRKYLQASGYIRIERLSANADIVLKPFSLNDREYNVRERFTCAAHQGMVEKIALDKDKLG